MALVVIGAVQQFDEGVRADVTLTVGSIQPGSVALVVLGVVLAIAGAVLLHQRYERWRISRQLP